MRKATRDMMHSVEKDLEKHINETSFPYWIVDKFRQLKINGLQISQKYGGPGLTTREAGAVVYEIAKVDSSIGLWFLIQNGIGMSVIDKLGSEEQKLRLLPTGMNFDRFYRFGLTEPDFGSDASSLITTAKKVEEIFPLNFKNRSNEPPTSSFLVKKK